MPDIQLLRLRRLGIDTYQEPVLYLHRDCDVGRAEGFEAQSRVEVRLRGRSVIATLNVVMSELLGRDEAALSESAWHMLQARPGDQVELRHSAPLDSLNRQLTTLDMRSVTTDVYATVPALYSLSVSCTASSAERRVCSATAYSPSASDCGIRSR